MKKVEAAVIGVSAGGFNALCQLVPLLSPSLSFPIIIVQHMKNCDTTRSYLWEHLNKISAISVKEADEKESLLSGQVYIAPAGYHLLIEDNQSFTLSVDDFVCYARPSIDVLFESAVDVYGKNLIGIILTGANHDGSQGLKHIEDHNGITIVQDPDTAECPVMPSEALKQSQTQNIMQLDKIAHHLNQLSKPAMTDSH